jgi:iron complex outermembrane recepter protein
VSPVHSGGILGLEMGLGWRVNSVGLLRVAALATVSAVVLLPKMSVAQSASSGGAAAAQDLPPVTVNPAPARRRATPQTELRTRAPTQVAARPTSKPPAPRTGPVVENPRGPINGYVAKRSSSGTKTNTPINETPQAISVVGAEQIRDQKPGKFDEILRYSPGVLAGTFGADTRNDWFLIRGFKSDDNSLFLDGLQLFYTSYASWKLQPFNLERVEVLRGPSAVLYGGSSPSGIVNAISKMPPAEPIRYIEAGVNNFGNAYVSFDVGGPVQTSKDNGQLLYRLVGQVQNGGTQVDFTPNNNYFIAPSFTYRPDADTSITVLASASKLDTRGEAFLPYAGTVVDASFGRIPTSRFTGDPSVDKFTREQEMLGYQFERNLTDDLTFRQNARFAHVDVNYATLYGLGLAASTSTDLLRGNFYTNGRANQADLDNQLEYRFRTGALQHTALLGVDLKHYSIDDYQGFGSASSLNLVNPVYTPTAGFSGAPYQNATLTQKQAGLYLQDQIKLDRFTLVLSGRNDWVNTYDDNHIGASLGRDDSQFSGRVGLIYNFDNGLAPYAAYATSYNPIIGTNFTLNQLYLPETGKQAEVGVKYQPTWFDGHFGATLFDLKRQNVLTTDPNNSLLSVQTGEVTSRGVELEAVANITPELKTMASYTRYDLFVSKDGDPTLIGKVPTNTPREITSAWADYTFKSGPLTGFGFGGGVRYVGSSFADNMNAYSVPSYVLGDAVVHYEWDKWRLALNVANITDKTYVANCSSLTACFYGDRRRITGSIAYKW